MRLQRQWLSLTEVLSLTNKVPDTVDTAPAPQSPHSHSSSDPGFSIYRSQTFQASNEPEGQGLGECLVGEGGRGSHRPKKIC